MFNVLIYELQLLLYHPIFVLDPLESSQIVYFIFLHHLFAELCLVFEQVVFLVGLRYYILGGLLRRNSLLWRR